MNAYVLPNGNLMVPLRAESADGVIGDGMVVAEAGSTLYEEWLPWALDTEEME